VPFKPEWETLNEARQRIIATGLQPAQAERDLCRAITERQVAVRQIIAPPSGWHEDRKPLEGPDLKVPIELDPTEINWPLSQPLDRAKNWADFSGRLVYMTSLQIDRARPFLEWTVDRIEVRAADVTRVFCGPQDMVDVDRPAATREPADVAASPGSPGRVRNRGTKTQGIADAIQALWPGGIPASLGVKQRDGEINAWLKANRNFIVDPITIRRFFKV
jgi:hypothetical protein